MSQEMLSEQVFGAQNANKNYRNHSQLMSASARELAETSNHNFKILKTEAAQFTLGGQQ